LKDKSKYLLLLLLGSFAFSHGVTGGDQGYIQEISGMNIVPFMYLGAKHMVTGYDHILFLVGVIFFLYRLQDVGLYVSLFAIGHSSTLLLGVFADISINAYFIDAVIGLSIVYKALDNLDAYKRWLGWQPNTKIATLIFGLFHGFGLASKIQEFSLSKDGLLVNLISFNIGVEMGQIIALSVVLIFMSFWRKTGKFEKYAYNTNVALMSGGFILMGYQLTGLFYS